MKISATVALAALVSFNADLVSAKCFVKLFGHKLDVKESKGWVDFACKGNGGMFTGNFAPGQTKRMCPKSKYSNVGTTLFEVENQNKNAGFDLGNDDCVLRLNSEIEKCEFGGESSYSGWRFKWVFLFFALLVFFVVLDVIVWMFFLLMLCCDRVEPGAC